MSETPPHVVNVDELEWTEHGTGGPFAGGYKPLTPFMAAKGRQLGVNVSRMPPGKVGGPFHYHQLEDEVFFVLSGRGVLRYGDDLRTIRAGDCISCPAGTKVAHQLANPFDEDLVYLGIGPNDPNEVCVYPDSGKIMVRSEKRIGWLEKVAYEAGEPEVPKIFEMAKKLP